MILVIMAAAWKQISYNFLFFSPDCSRSRRRYWKRHPLMAPASGRSSGRSPSVAVADHVFLLVVNIVYAFFDTFGIIDAVTNGGPAKATEVLVYKVYYDGVHSLNLGSSSAQSVILMAIVIVLTAVQFRYVERKVHY